LRNHRLIVAMGFRVCGWLLGAPMLAALVGLTVSAFALHHAAAPDASKALDIKAYGLFGVLASGARDVDHVLAWLAGAAAWVAFALAVVSLVGVAMGVLFYVTGRGIDRRATWARILAVLISLWVLLSAAATAAALPRDLALLAALPVGVSLYVLWVLIWRFV